MSLQVACGHPPGPTPPADYAPPLRSPWRAAAEWKALMVFTTKNPVVPKEPPTLREAIHRVAGLGGFLGRKGDGEPGTQTLWLGLQRLDDIAAMWLVMFYATQKPVSSRDDSG